MSELTLKHVPTWENKIIHLSSLFSLTSLLHPSSSLMLALPPCPSLVRKLSISSTTWRWRVLSGIEAFIRFLFQFVWCLFNAVEMEKCSSYNNYYCFGIMVKGKKKKRKMTKKKNPNKTNEKCVVECCTDSTRDVVFFNESTNLSDGPFHSSRRADGNKTACQSIQTSNDWKRPRR